ncbi:MAG: hypothetical protein QOG83_2709 [Alphaproteobacteria bacterium]|jgi:hypothetical protein|nr:hypothetical protein [Alphaproteobacteria bacterium]
MNAPKNPRLGREAQDDPGRRSKNSGAAPAKSPAKSKADESKTDDKAEARDASPPGELLEGEGDPGLTITGGGGHA